MYNFNKLPFIDTSYSDIFRQKAEDIIQNHIPNWMDFLSSEYKEPDDSALNILIDTGSIKQSSIREFNTHVRKINESLIFILTELFKKTIVYTNKDLVSQIEKACKSINDIPEELTGLIELSGHIKFKFKSKEWILHHTMSCTSKVKKLAKCEDLFDSVIPPQTHFLMMDDGMYSGSQNVFLINGILSKKENITIYLFVMFVAEVGINLIREFFTLSEETPDYSIFILGTNKIYLWKKYIILPSVRFILKNITDTLNITDSQFNYIYESILEKAGSITVFEHKIPDYKSLPWIVANVFYISMPEYFVNTPVYAPISREPNFIENEKNFDLSFGKSKKSFKLSVLENKSDIIYLK